MNLTPTDGSGGGLQSRPTIDEITTLINNAIGRITTTIINGVREELYRAVETMTASNSTTPVVVTDPELLKAIKNVDNTLMTIAIKRLGGTVINNNKLEF